MGLYGDALKISVTAAAVDGQANAALIAFLARALSVRPGSVRLISGQSSRTKLIEVDDLGLADLQGLAAESSHQGG